jgi:hypothetical protein
MSPETTPNPETGQAAVKEVPKPAQKERRAFRRRPFRARVRIQTDALGMGPLVEVSGLNISEGGISFTTPKEVKIGKLITVEISRQSTGKQTKWEAEVKWVKPLNEKQFHAGCMWRRRLNFTDIQNFL